MLGEPLQTVAGMAQGSKGAITFDDEATGALLSYTLASSKGPLHQYFVLRVHDGRVATATGLAREGERLSTGQDAPNPNRDGGPRRGQGGQVPLRRGRGEDARAGARHARGAPQHLKSVSGP